MAYGIVISHMRIGLFSMAQLIQFELVRHHKLDSAGVEAPVYRSRLLVLSCFVRVHMSCGIPSGN